MDKKQIFAIPVIVGGCILSSCAKDDKELEKALIPQHFDLTLFIST